MEGEPINVNEFQELARLALPKMYYDYYNGGAEDQYTLKENVESFRRIAYAAKSIDHYFHKMKQHFTDNFCGFSGCHLESL